MSAREVNHRLNRPSELGFDLAIAISSEMILLHVAFNILGFRIFGEEWIPTCIYYFDAPEPPTPASFAEERLSIKIEIEKSFRRRDEQQASFVEAQMTGKSLTAVKRQQERDETLSAIEKLQVRQREIDSQIAQAELQTRLWRQCAHVRKLLLKAICNRSLTAVLSTGDELDVSFFSASRSGFFSPATSMCEVKLCDGIDVQGVACLDRAQFWAWFEAKYPDPNFSVDFDEKAAEGWLSERLSNEEILEWIARPYHRMLLQLQFPNAVISDAAFERIISNIKVNHDGLKHRGPKPSDKRKAAKTRETQIQNEFSRKFGQ